MRWHDKQLLGASTLALVLAGCGGKSFYEGGARPEKAVAQAQNSAVLEDSAITIGEPYTIAGQRFEPRDDMTFDEVGYAIVRNGETLSSGEPNESAFIAVSHRILPIPSYVEVTHLGTGKTILARVNDRGPMLKDRITALSPAAAQLLGVNADGSTPVRVRRVNPPFSEKATLRSGVAAPERLDTPPALLSALRRRLNETMASKPADAVAMAPVEAPAVTMPRAAARPAARPAAKPALGRGPGADFDVETPSRAPAPRSAQASRAAAQPRTVSVSAPQPATVGRKGRFIVEDANGQPLEVTTSGAVEVNEIDQASPVRTQTSAARPARGASNYFVQIASFDDAGRAKALANAARGSVDKAGSVYRVRTGPYSDEGEAKLALSHARSKGYRDARIAR